jgi:23S rRNA (guanosine2251-2'-O)-methyltransferase
MNKKKHIQIEGRNTILEIIRRNIAISEIFVDAHARIDKKLDEILSLAGEKKTTIRRVNRSILDKMSSTGVHMGVIAYADTPPLPTRLKDILEDCYLKNEEPFLLLLSDVVYQQNLGAVTRTANAAGVHGIIVPKKQRNPMTPEVIRVSMGAAFFTPVIAENLFIAIKLLKSEGIRIIGADMTGEVFYSDANLRGSVAFVLGGEHKGISEPEKKRCDKIVSMPMNGTVSSLNVSVACGILLYEKIRQDKLKAST